MPGGQRESVFRARTPYSREKNGPDEKIRKVELKSSSSLKQEAIPNYGVRGRRLLADGQDLRGGYHH